MHCASLGEFEQGRPVVEALKRAYPDLTVIVTFFSPSGYEIRKDYPGADHIFYLPMDSPANARKFLDEVKPDLVLWIKYDYWYYYLREIQKRRIPALLISPVFRPDQPFFKWYGNIHRLMLDSFHAFFVQNEDSKKLLGTLGISQTVFVNGDTRFDRVIDIAGSEEAIPGISAFCNGQPVIVAGSTWEEDEEELDHFANTHPDIRFIIAPHEIDALLDQVERRVVRDHYAVPLPRHDTEFEVRQPLARNINHGPLARDQATPPLGLSGGEG